MGILLFINRVRLQRNHNKQLAAISSSFRAQVSSQVPSVLPLPSPEPVEPVQQVEDGVTPLWTIDDVFTEGEPDSLTTGDEGDEN